MSVATVIGTRPEFVKCVPVSAALVAAGIEEIVINTGQHYDFAMSERFFEELAIARPEYHLDVRSGRHGRQTADMLTGIEQVLVERNPDVLIVYGDTNSTLAGALAAAKLHIPVAHIEAGLRSFNRRMPEEVNRVLTDHLSAVLFAPTTDAVANLRREGLDAHRVHLVGDVNYDIGLMVAARLGPRPAFVEALGLTFGRYILATIHRAENTDDADRLRAILGGLVIVNGAMPVVLPLHPRTAAAIDAIGGVAGIESLRIIDPLGFLEMSALEIGAAAIVTDSGGVQKEAFVHGRPCVTVRDETEWVELVELGWNRVVPPTSAADVAAGVRESIGTVGSPAIPYGDGHASVRIAHIIGSMHTYS